MTPASQSSRLSMQGSRDHLIAELHDLYAPLPSSEIQSLFTSSLNTTSSPPAPSRPSHQVEVAKAAAAPLLDPFANNLQGTQLLPSPSPGVSTAKKRKRGGRLEHAAIGQSHSRSSTASAASASRRGNITNSSKRGSNTWELRYIELVSLQYSRNCILI